MKFWPSLENSIWDKKSERVNAELKRKIMTGGDTEQQILHGHSLMPHWCFAKEEKRDFILKSHEITQKNM